MKRKALLIGNTRGLEGVAVDLERTRRFLRSSRGGTWLSDEINTFYNPSKSQIETHIGSLKRESLDYLFVLFSGHGGHARSTMLELNGRGELILDSQLHNIASRQVNIYDCCRVVVEEARKSIALDSISSFSEAYSGARQRYEEKIMQAIPQQVQLYACSIGQKSYDTSSGAIYLSNLLDSAQAIASGDDFKTVESAHAEAQIKTLRDKPEQKPEGTFPKCLISQQLIISMRA